MVNEWTESGKWDGRKSVKVGNGMGSEWADSGTGSWTGTVYLAVGRETREQKSVTGEVGKGNIVTVPVPVPFPTTFPVPTFTARSPGKIQGFPR